MSNESLKNALKQRDSIMEVCQKMKEICDEKIEAIRLLECDVEELKGYVVKEMKEGEGYRQFGCVMVGKNEELKKENEELIAWWSKENELLKKQSIRTAKENTKLRKENKELKA